MYGLFLKNCLLIQPFSGHFLLPNPSQVALVIACVIGVIVYRVAMNAVFYSFNVSYVKSYAKILTSVTAACINLVVILILSRVSP